MFFFNYFFHFEPIISHHMLSSLLIFQNSSSHTFSDHDLFFTLISVSWIYTYRYNLFSLYIVICMYVFKADYLVLDNQFMSSSLRKTISIILSRVDSSFCLFFFWFDLMCMCRFQVLWVFYVNMSTAVLVQLVFAIVSETVWHFFWYY